MTTPNLEVIAQEMRSYAIAHPLNPVEALQSGNPAQRLAPYTRVLLLSNGQELKITCSYTVMGRMKFIQLSAVTVREGVSYPVPPALVSQILPAFFAEGEEITPLPGISQQWAHFIKE